jgi:CRP-like cAMP-binding protein
MTDSQRDLMATRGAQMFPRRTDDELSRLSRVGEPRSFKAGEMISRIGETGPGLMLILSGEVEVTQNDQEIIATVAHLISSGQVRLSDEAIEAINHLAASLDAAA